MQRTWLQTAPSARPSFQEVAEDLETQMEADPNRWMELGWETRYLPLHLMFEDRGYYVPTQLVAEMETLARWEQQMMLRYLMSLVEDQRLPELGWGTHLNQDQLNLARQGLTQLKQVQLKDWEKQSLQELPPVELDREQAE